MSATLTIVVTDNDGPDPEYTLYVDHFVDYDEGVEAANQIAAEQYSHTGVIPRLADGTPYWGAEE